MEGANYEIMRWYEEIRLLLYLLLLRFE